MLGAHGDGCGAQGWCQLAGKECVGTETGAGVAFGGMRQSPPGGHPLLGESFLCRREKLQRPSKATGHVPWGLAPDSHGAGKSWPSCPHPELAGGPQSWAAPLGSWGASADTRPVSGPLLLSLPHGVRAPGGYPELLSDFRLLEHLGVVC